MTGHCILPKHHILCYDAYFVLLLPHVILMISTCLKNALGNVQFASLMMYYWVDTSTVFKFVSYSCIYFEMTF